MEAKVLLCLALSSPWRCKYYFPRNVDDLLDYIEWESRRYGNLQTANRLKKQSIDVKRLPLLSYDVRDILMAN
jgi:hypothetical protein